MPATNVEKGGRKRTQFLTRLREEEDAADATEYALIAALIAIAIMASTMQVGGALREAFERLAQDMPVFGPA